MKNTSRLVPILAGAIAATGGWGVIAAGCGSSNSSSQQGTGTDATTDVVEDTLVAQETAPPPDAGSQPDADASASPDADASTPDSSAGDSSVSVTAQTFPGQLATAWCSTIAACCGTSGDAATFNWAACYSATLAAGVDKSNTGVNLLDGGHVVFNAAQAQTCLNIVSAADCTSDEITSSEEMQVYQSCFAAYSGTLATGTPCAGTIECAPGNFCLPVNGGVGDAGAIGSCQVLVDAGGACGFLGSAGGIAQTICSYRGSGSSGLFCPSTSADGGTVLAAAARTCQPQWAAGSVCTLDVDCASFVCHQYDAGVQLCESAGNWANSTTCAGYAVAVPADAGGGG